MQPFKYLPAFASLLAIAGAAPAIAQTQNLPWVQMETMMPKFTGRFMRRSLFSSRANIPVSMKPLIYVNAIRCSREFLPDFAHFKGPPGNFA